MFTITFPCCQTQCCHHYTSPVTFLIGSKKASSLHSKWFKILIHATNHLSISISPHPSFHLHLQHHQCLCFGVSCSKSYRYWDSFLRYGSLESNRQIHSFFHLSKSCSVLSLSNSLVFRVLADLPVCICEYATRLVCHHSLTPLWCLPNQRRLLQQKPRAHWSAWCLCSPLEYPSDSASQASWPQSLQAPSISVSFMLCLSLNITCKLSNHYRFHFVM